nr:type II toxin-antitoxin system RelE/ParE family toxin [Bacteroidota bacterium]
MAYKVRWTPEAEETFDFIIYYLNNRWTEREIINFVTKANHLIDQIAEHPKMFRLSSKRNIRVGFITHQTSLFYQISETENLILLLSFWDNRQDPEKRKY